MVSRTFSARVRGTGDLDAGPGPRATGLTRSLSFRSQLTKKREHLRHESFSESFERSRTQHENRHFECTMIQETSRTTRASAAKRWSNEISAIQTENQGRHERFL